MRSRASSGSKGHNNEVSSELHHLHLELPAGVSMDCGVLQRGTGQNRDQPWRSPNGVDGH